MARDERLSRDDSDRLEKEILDERKRLYKEALLELMKENPEEIYSCTLEVLKRLRADTDRRILQRARHMKEFAVLFLIGLVALAWYWTRH